MGSHFNTHILVDKLTKLNSSQQSIETLSHWCIFHMNNAKQVVETWDRQFHCSPREQRLAFLYLANDILQNSRRKGAEFVAEFWKVLPDSLRDVIKNGDGPERNAALRLINIWEERKVFGSRGQLLKVEFMKRQLDDDNKNLKPDGFKLRPPGGKTLDKLVSGYQAVYGSQLDEGAIYDKCRHAISFIEKVDKDIEGGQVNGSITEELKGQHAILRDSIEQLRAVESSRANLVTLLREALQEQEFKLDQVRNQLQATRTHSEQAGTGNGRILTRRSGNQNTASPLPQSFTPGAREQSTSVVYTRKSGPTEEQEDPKSAAAQVAAKLAASTSSAEMLTFVLSSIASEGVSKESSVDYPSEKRARIENDHPESIPNEPPPPLPPLPPTSPPPEPPLPPPTKPYQVSQCIQAPMSITSPPPLPPPPKPYQVPQYTTAPVSIPSGTYVYNMNQPPPPGYCMVQPPTNGVALFAPMYYPTDGGLYGQPTPPMGRQ
ncbi:hypothetical protein ACJIZ3_015185 [Penstemon smallii]|uniref:CID domain-containing protein n=1 Tax=Penstemon smallii TaxID=265156 RepID=A0ABD3RLS3_9LAMI